MKNEEITAEQASDKRVVERSAAYPAIPLNEAIDFAATIARSLGFNQSFKREDVAQAVGRSEGGVIRDIAACVHFGLFERRQSEGYATSPLLKEILNPISNKERGISLVRALRSPKLYDAIITKFDGGVLPTELKIHLVRFHSIADKVSVAAAETFFTSAKFAGVLNDSNLLSVEKTIQSLSNGNFQFAEVLPDNPDGQSQQNSRTIQLPEGPKDQNRLPASENDETVKIRLTDKKYAYLVYPSNSLNAKDIEIIRKQIELIELGL